MTSTSNPTDYPFSDPCHRGASTLTFTALWLNLKLCEEESRLQVFALVLPISEEYVMVITRIPRLQPYSDDSRKGPPCPMKLPDTDSPAASSVSRYYPFLLASAGRIAFRMYILVLLSVAAILSLPGCGGSSTGAPGVTPTASDQDFAIVVLPDPQNTTQFHPEVLNAQMNWIVNNQKALNIKFVLTEGDNINDGAATDQLQNLDTAFRILDRAEIPYLLGVGNHDYNGYDPKASRDLSGFNQWFGPERYAGKSYFKGNFPGGSNANSYAVVSINGKQAVFITLEYRPRSASLDWAESILAANADKEAVLVAHSFLLKDNMREDLCDDQDMTPGINATGQETWMRLRKFSNLSMIVSGHFTGGSGARRADMGDSGNLVNQLFADYQDYSKGSNGWLRILQYHPSSNSISVQTYSPTLDKYMTDGNNQFTLDHHNALRNTGMGAISGRVRSKTDCAPIAGTRITAGSASTTTAADGTYRLPMATGNYEVSASGPAGSSSKSEKVNDSLDTQVNFYLPPSPLAK